MFRCPAQSPSASASACAEQAIPRRRRQTPARTGAAPGRSAESRVNGPEEPLPDDRAHRIATTLESVTIHTSGAESPNGPSTEWRATKERRPTGRCRRTAGSSQTGVGFPEAPCLSTPFPRVRVAPRRNQHQLRGGWDDAFDESVSLSALNEGCARAPHPQPRRSLGVGRAEISVRLARSLIKPGSGSARPGSGSASAFAAVVARKSGREPGRDSSLR